MNRRSGNSLLEFTLTGLPLIFIGIAIIECALGMYEYQSMANAVTVAARYAANHGAGCSQNGNTCTIRIEDIASVITAYTTIMAPATLTVSFTDNNATTTCTLDNCLTNSSQFPSSTNSANVAGNPITISLTHTINNPMPIFWPPRADTDNSGYTLGANSVQVIQF